MSGPREDQAAYETGQAAVLLTRSASREKLAAAAELSYGLKGKLYLSKSGWILLQIPNGLARGAFDALSEVGAELPAGKDGRFNARVSIVRPEELTAAGLDPEKITERGHDFAYTLGPVREVAPAGWDGVSKVWFISIVSPQLQNLRKSYGLTPLPQRNGEELPFHCTFAIRRKNVLYENGFSKGRQQESLIHRPGLFADHFRREAPPATLEVKAAAHPALPRLLRAQAYSDVLNYAAKQQLIRELMEEAPHEWQVDKPKGKYHGITHLPTQFKLHISPMVIPRGIKRAAEERGPAGEYCPDCNYWPCKCCCIADKDGDHAKEAARNARTDQNSGIPRLGRNDSALYESKNVGVQELWRAGDSSLSSLAQQFCKVSAGYGHPANGADTGAKTELAGILARQALGDKWKNHQQDLSTALSSYLAHEPAGRTVTEWLTRQPKITPDPAYRKNLPGAWGGTPKDRSRALRAALAHAASGVSHSEYKVDADTGEIRGTSQASRVLSTLAKQLLELEHKRLSAMGTKQGSASIYLHALKTQPFTPNLTQSLFGNASRYLESAKATGDRWINEAETHQRFQAAADPDWSSRHLQRLIARREIPEEQIVTHPIDKILRGEYAADGLQEKQGNWWDDVKFHAPRIRLPDTLGGAAVGAGLGAGVYGVRRLLSDEDDPKKKPSLASHLLTGAGLGAAGGNLVGDRARRYLSNNLVPFGYDTAGRMDEIKPKSLKHVWDTLVRDVPAEHAQNLSNYGAPVAARAELLRRGLGLPVRDPLFQSTGYRKFKPTGEDSGGIPGVFEHVEFRPEVAQQAAAGNSDVETKTNLNESLQALQKHLQQGRQDGRPPFRGWPFADILSRHGTEYTPPDAVQPTQARVFDLWDFAPEPKEEQQISDYLKSFLKHPAAKPQGSPTWKDVREPIYRKAFNALLPGGGVVFDQKIDVSDPDNLKLLHTGT